MHQRLSRFALIVAIGVTALALSASDGGGPDSRQRTASDPSLAVQIAGVDAAVARISTDDRRDAAGSDRSLKQRLGLLPALVSLVLVTPLCRRGVAVPARSRRPKGWWWSHHSGRAPPPFSFPIF